MSEKVTFKELVDSIAGQTDNTRKFTHEFLKDLVSVINSNLEEDGKVNIAGFGKFELRHMDEREGFNPQSGEKMTIPEHNKVVFKPYKDLRELVNAPYLHLEPKILEEDKGETEAASPEPPQKTGASALPDVEIARKTEEEESDSVSREEKSSFVFDESAAMDEREKEVPEAHEEEFVATDGGDDSSSLDRYIDKAKTKDTQRDDIAEEAPVRSGPGESVSSKPVFSSRRKKEKPAMSRGVIAAAAVILIVLIGAWFLMNGTGNSDSSTPVVDLPQNETVQRPDMAAPETTSSTSQPPQAAPTSSPDQQTASQNNESREDPIQLTVDEGQTLWSIASTNYQDPYLWPWIYDANSDSIANPNLIVAGKTLSIPIPDEPDLDLSSTDSLEVALGYVETYRWHKENQNEDAKFYLWAAKLYDEDVFNNVSRPIDEEDLAFANGVR